ncbi:hypothetical protein B0H14DRAFT_3467815 [Mycena olivaceomarginata]|nr:hypothetical protein B0H14DRAFT_3467815 [Mycena olivaceomarginata]
MNFTMHIYTDTHSSTGPALTSPTTSTTTAATASDPPSAGGEVEGLLSLVDRLSSTAMEAMCLAEEVRATIPGVIANEVARASAATSPASGAGPLWLGGVSRTPAELEAAHPEGTGEIWYVVVCGREPGMYHSPDEANHLCNGVPGNHKQRKKSRREALAWYREEYERGNVQKWTEVIEA